MIWGNNTHFKKSRKSFIHSGVLFVHLFAFVWVAVRKYVRLSNLQTREMHYSVWNCSVQDQGPAAFFVSSFLIDGAVQ